MPLSVASPAHTVDNGATAGFSVTVDGLVLQFDFNTEPVTPPVAPVGYGASTPAVSSAGAAAAMQVFYRSVSTAGDILAQPTNLDADGGPYLYIGMQLTEAASASAPAAPLPQVLRLGCAETYDVFITANNRETQEPEIVDAIGWSDLRWNRVEDDASTASITIPDKYGGVRCVAKYGGLKPWRYGVRVERNGQLVWSGPVTSIVRPVRNGVALPQIEVGATDLFGRFMRRLAVQRETLQVSNEDAGSIFRRIAGETALVPWPHNGFNLPIPSFAAGTALSREVVYRDFEYAWEVLKGLFESAVDGYIMNGVAYFFEPGTGWIYTDGREDHLVLPGPYDSSTGELVYGLFENSAFAQEPGWGISGFSQGNTGYITGADTGEMGARRYWSAFNAESWELDGVLDFVDTNTLFRSGDEDAVIADSAYQRRVDSAVALRSQAPATIEGGTLSQNAPVDMDNLRPGSVWRLDIEDAGFGQLLQLTRLKRIEVTVSLDEGGVAESVSPTLQPLGYTESDL
jgi:hypothetical protein